MHSSQLYTYRFSVDPSACVCNYVCMNEAAGVASKNPFSTQTKYSCRTESERACALPYKYKNPGRGRMLQLCRCCCWGYCPIIRCGIESSLTSVCSDSFAPQDVDEEIVGHLRSAAGKARLLATQKIRQFEGMCEGNVFVFVCFRLISL